MKKQIVLRLIIVVLLIPVFCGCSLPGNQQEIFTKDGQVVLNILNVIPGRTNRGIYLSDIRGYNITIEGQGFPKIADTIEMKENNVKVYSLDIVNNVIVTAEPLDPSGIPIVQGLKLYGYGDVTGDAVTTLNVNWELTPVGSVLDHLYEAGYDLGSYNPSNLQAAVDTAALDTNFNYLAVDTAAIAAGIQSDPHYVIVDMLGTGIINGTVNGFSEAVLEGAKAMINEPFAAPVYIIDNSFTFPAIAPGIWRISLSDGLKGYVDVTVNDDGSISDTVTINSGNKTPVVYGWNITAYTENGIQKGLVSAFANDEDGIADIDTVECVLPDLSGKVLNNDGSSCVFDTIQDDRLFEGIIQQQLQDDTYSLTVNDGDVTVTEESGFTFNYINSPVITGITEGEEMTDRTPSITWQSITGASYYNIFVYYDDVLLLTELDLNAQTTSYTCTQELADGNYIIKLYASTDRWPENDNVVYETITSLSLRSVSFSVQVSGIVDIDVGELLYGYYRADDTIRRVTLTERVYNYPIVYDAPYGNTLVLKGISPCGQSLLYTENNRLYKIKENGSGRFLLYSKTDDEILNVKWSPDGDSIAFTVKVDDDWNHLSLYVIKEDGSGLTLIDPSINSGFAFSGDGLKIYFQNRSNMYLSRINRDGTGLTTIGDNPLIYYVLGMELSLDKDKMLLAGGDFNIYHINDNTISVLDFNPLYYTYKTAYWTSDNRIVCTNQGTSDAIYFIKSSDETWTTCSYYSVFLRSYTTTTFAFPSPSGKRIYTLEGGSGATDIYYFDENGNNGSSLCYSQDIIVYNEFFVSPYTW